MHDMTVWTSAPRIKPCDFRTTPSTPLDDALFAQKMSRQAATLPFPRTINRDRTHQLFHPCFSIISGHRYHKHKTLHYKRFSITKEINFFCFPNEEAVCGASKTCPISTITLHEKNPSNLHEAWPRPRDDYSLETQPSSTTHTRYKSRGNPISSWR